MSEPQDPNKYATGTKVKACDVMGVTHINEGCDDDEIIVKWETQQQYAYTREWLDDNVEIIK